MTGAGGGLPAGSSSLTPGQLREIALRKEAGESWGVIERALGRTCRDAYLRANRNGALARALAGAGDADADAGPPTTAAETGEPLRSCLPAAGASPTIEQTADADGGVTLRVRDLPRVRTVDEVIEAGGLDPAHWTIQSATLKAYEGFMKSAAGDPVVVPLTSAHVKLAPNLGARAAIAAMTALIDRMATRAPVYPVPRSFSPADEDLLLEVNISDAHVGALAWGPEAGEDYDSSIAAADWRHAVADIVALANQWRVARIVLPTGNDLFHSDQAPDGKGGATTKGTLQDVDTRWPKMLETGTELVVDTIDQLRVIAPVDVVMVMGNHAMRSEFQLGQVLKAWYRADDLVTVANPYSVLYPYEWGDVLIAYAHGHGINPGDLPMAMAQSFPAAWGRTRWREAHIGHRHAAKTTTHALKVARIDVIDEPHGVRVVTIPGLTATDAYHASRLLRHLRCAEARLWSKTRGLVGVFNVWLRPGEERAA